MAKKVKHDAPASHVVKRIDAEKFQRTVAEINRQKENASEYAGMAGKLVSTAIDQQSLDRVAFGFTLRLSRMDAAKQQAAIRNFIEYVGAAGMLDQLDAFSEIADILEDTLKMLKARIPNTPRDEDGVMSTLVN